MPATTMSVLDSDRYDLGTLTDAEILWLWRHRQLATNGRLMGRSGPVMPMGRYGAAMSQSEAAGALGISEEEYVKLEHGRTGNVSAAVVALAQPLEPITPTIAELCQIARRRSGELLVDVYESANLSRPTYLRAERLGDPRIVSFWEDRGFSFRRG
jgi:DNA-binding XRE family transcriptional regulator